MLLSAILLTPLFGVLACLLLPSRRTRQVAAAISILSIGQMLFLWFSFDRSVTGYQFLEEYSWIPSLGISLRLGIDGIAMLLILLTLLLLPLQSHLGLPKDEKQ